MALNFPTSPAHLDQYTDPNLAIWQYDSDGPYWSVITSTTRKNFSGAKATIGADFGLANVFEKLDFAVEEFDIDNYYPGSQGTFTVPTTGYYRILIILFSGTGGEGSSYTFDIRKNGASIQLGTIGPNQSTVYDQTLSLVSGDYLEVFAKESTSTGTTLGASQFNIYRLGFSPGPGISNHNAFSGVRATTNTSVSTTSAATAISWSGTDFNANANVNGDLYWFNSVPNRVTVRATAYYKVRSYVKAGTAGSSDSYTITLRKNGTTSLTSITLSANDFVDLDEVYSLAEDDYLELMISNSDNIGSVTSDTYLEVTREGL